MSQYRLNLGNGYVMAVESPEAADRATLACDQYRAHYRIERRVGSPWADEGPEWVFVRRPVPADARSR